MSNKEAMHTIRDDDKQDLQKQLGCMNGIFQIFDRRFLLGQRRHGNNQKRLPPGQSDNGEKEVKNVKENAPKVVTKEKDRASVELPRHSFSSSSSSTAMSSLDYSKRVQTEVSSSCQSVISESPSSPFLHRKKPNLSIQSPDIRDVVKDSMTREPRVVSIKPVAKDERVGTAMKHIDSPRPFPPQKHIQYDRIDRSLRELKETARFSCDGRESRYQLKPNMKIKELPRLSLDSRQGYISNSANDPISNKRPSSVVARLMGLEVLKGTIDESKTLKTNTCLDKESVLNSRTPRKEDKLKHDCTSASPKVQKPQRGVKVSRVITRIPLETAPWKQEGAGHGPQKPPFKIKEGSPRADQASRSIYDEIEKRLTEDEYKTAGKDLRALKQILEAMQKAKRRLENKEHALDNSSIDDRLNQKVDQPVSPTISQRKVKHADVRKESVGRNRLKDPALRDRKVTGRPLSTSNFPEHSGTVSPRLQRSKNGTHGPSSDWIRPKKQPGMQRKIPGSTNRNTKAKSMDPLQDNSETRNLSQQSDTISFQSNDSEVMSTEWGQEVNSPFRPEENQRVSKSNITERLTEEKSIDDHAKHTMEQPSPVSVLDAFYTEDTPSPVKKISNAFTDVENVHFEGAQDQSRMNKLANRTNPDQYSEFDTMKLENIKNLVHQIELLSTNTDDATVNHTVKSSCHGETGDHRYVEEIVLASGCLKDLDRTTTIVQLHPTVSLINPGLFHVLEKTKACTEVTDDGYNKSFMSSKIRRKMLFDTVNDVLSHELAMLGPFGPHKGRILNGEKLLKELCSGIDGLQNKSEIVYDEDDEVTNIINADVNKRSQDWDEYCHQVPGVVLDIERLIFKDLISEVVNFQITGLQDWPTRPHCRRLFTM